MENKLRLLPDVPWGEGVAAPETAKDQDGLRFHQYADILARAALDTPEPFTIGVYGGWGSGKTSLMRMMWKIVEEEEGAIPVWFNAWRYEKEEHLIVPLLATIITEMKERHPKWEKMKEGGAKLLNAFRSVLYGVSVKGGIRIPGLSEAELSVSPKDMIDKYQAINKEIAAESILDQSLYFRAFNDLDRIVRESKCPRIVIFVDDLDRCFPNKAVSLLEGIKLVLNQPNIAFVLGIAPRIIQAYLKDKYKREYNVPEDLYEDYLDKLVQLSFDVPEIGENVGDYVRGLLKREEIFGKIEDQVFQEEYEPLVSICGPACKDNPRKIVRFLNRLLIMKRVHETKEDAKKAQNQEYVPMSISLVHFGITQALAQNWPQVLRACERKELIPVVSVEDHQDTAEELCSYLVKRIEKRPDLSNTRVAAVLVGDLAEGKPYRATDVFRILANPEDDSLLRLFRSKPGLEWLRDPKLRKAIETVAKEASAGETAKHPPRYEPPWAQGYSKEGWPLRGGCEIKPGAVLRGTAFISDNLSGADFRDADLEDTAFLNADLSKANLRGANLVGANLCSANLMGTDLRDAKIEGAKFEKAIYDSTTQWSEGFAPQERGMVFLEPSSLADKVLKMFSKT